MSRLTIDITEEQHQNLKAIAVLQGKTIKQYTLERLFPDNTDADQACQEMKMLLNSRIKAGLEGNVSSKTVTQILAEEEMVQDDKA